MAMVYQSLGNLAVAEQWLLRTVELDEASGHPDLARGRYQVAVVVTSDSDLAAPIQIPWPDVCL